MISKAKNYILDFLNQQKNHRLTFHNFAYIERWIAMIDEIGQSMEYSDEVIQTAQLTANFVVGASHSETMELNILSKAIADEFFSNNDVPIELCQSVFVLLSNYYNGKSTDTEEAKLLFDSENIVTYAKDFEMGNALQRLEWEMIHKKELTTGEWAQAQLQKLLATRLILSYSKLNFEEVISQNIIDMKKIVMKNINNLGEMELDGKFQKLEKRIPLDAIHTFYRTNYRNHINLSSIADKKANIMISVNAIIISVLISILSYQNITERNPMVLMPVIIFLISGLSSLIFAVLSARPKVTKLNNRSTSLEDTNKNIVFFGNFVHMDVESYENAIDAMFRSSELIYGNLTRDLYYLGQVLDRKYRLLSIAYNIFMVGFGATVVTFLIAMFFG